MSVQETKPVTVEEAQKILDKAKEVFREEVPSFWWLMLRGMERRLSMVAPDVLGTIPECIHGELHEELCMPNRPCKGKRVTCNHPENKITDWYEAGCTSTNCVYYEAKED